MRALREMELYNPAALEQVKLGETLFEALQSVGDLREAESRRLLQALDGIALGQPESSRGYQPASLLLHFDSADAVRPLFDGKRLAKQRETEIAGAEVWRWSFEPEDDLHPSYDRVLALVGIRSDGVDVVWFEQHALLVLGELRFAERVADVIAGKRPAFSESEAYQQARAEWMDDAALVMVLDRQASFLRNAGEDYDDLAEALAPSLLPSAMSAAIHPTGIATAERVRVRGKLAPPMILMQGIDELTSPARLPANTLAYASFGIGDYSAEQGRDALATALKRWNSYSISSPAAREDAEAALEEFMARIDLGALEALDSVQGEFTLAIVHRRDEQDNLFTGLSDRFDSVAEGVDFLSEHFALVAVAEVNDETHTALIASIQASIERNLKAWDEADTGKSLTIKMWPKGEAEWQIFTQLPDQTKVKIAARRYGESTVFVFGNNHLALDTFNAFEGSGPRLGDQPAWQRARRAVGERGMIECYLDLGVLLAGFQRYLKAEGVAKDDLPIPSDLLRTTGDARPIIMTSFTMQADGEDVLVDMRGWNSFFALDALLPMVSAIGAWHGLASSAQLPEELEGVEPKLLPEVAEGAAEMRRIKRVIEIGIQEYGESASNIEQLRDWGYLGNASGFGDFDDGYYGRFQWDGREKEGRWVGVMTALPHEAWSDSLPEVVFICGPDSSETVNYVYP